DGRAGAERELLEVLVGQFDVAPLLVLVPTDDVAPRDLVVALDAIALVLDAAPVLGAEEVERDLARALRRQIQPHGDGDHPEAHDALPDRSRHCPSPLGGRFPLLRAACRANDNGSVNAARAAYCGCPGRPGASAARVWPDP